MRCPIESDNPDLLLDYCSRTLSAEQSTQLEAHIEGCTACREFRDAQLAVWNALDDWRDIPVSEDFDQKLYARIAKEAEVPFWKRWTSLFQPFLDRPAIPAMAALLLLIAGSLLIYRPGELPVQPVAENGQIQVQVEQVERALDDLEMLKDLDLLEDGGSQQM